MKKLEDFNCEKVELNSIYGGRRMSMAFSDQNTVTVGDNGGNPDDGDDSAWD